MLQSKPYDPTIRTESSWVNIQMSSVFIKMTGDSCFQALIIIYCDIS
jgi:hypothetical protein